MKREHHRDHGDGLADDLRQIAALNERRQVLRFLFGASVLPLIGCSSNASTPAGAAASPEGGAADGEASASSCDTIPEETGGPYPGDGTNGPNTLTASGIVRSDIRPSFGAMTGTAEGISLTVKLTLVNVKAGCAALAGYAIYLWHCDRDGKYSLYTIADQNYLRGVQETDASGTVTFTTIFPGCYSGRWPHIHFEIFASLATATAAGGKVATSQLALPIDACNAVYTTSGYSQSITNLSQTSLATDNVFRDGATLQLPTVTGNANDGYVATLTVGVSV